MTNSPGSRRRTYRADGVVAVVAASDLGRRPGSRRAPELGAKTESWMFPKRSTCCTGLEERAVERESRPSGRTSVGGLDLRPRHPRAEPAAQAGRRRGKRCRGRGMCARRGEHALGVCDLERRDDAAAGLGRGDQKAVVGADERRPSRLEAPRPGGRSRRRDRRPPCASGPGDSSDAGEDRAPGHRRRPDPMGEVDHLRLRARPAGSRRGRCRRIVGGAEVREERDDGHRLAARKAMMPGGSPRSSSTRSSTSAAP